MQSFRISWHGTITIGDPDLPPVRNTEAAPRLDDTKPSEASPWPNPFHSFFFLFPPPKRMIHKGVDVLLRRINGAGSFN